MLRPSGKSPKMVSSQSTTAITTTTFDDRQDLRVDIRGAVRVDEPEQHAHDNQDDDELD